MSLTKKGLYEFPQEFCSNSAGLWELIRRLCLRSDLWELLQNSSEEISCEPVHP